MKPLNKQEVTWLKSLTRKHLTTCILEMSQLEGVSTQLFEIKKLEIANFNDLDIKLEHMLNMLNRKKAK